MTKNKKIRTEKKGTHPFQPSRDYYGDDIAETLGYTEKKILVKTKIKATTKNSVKTNVKRISTGTKTTSLNKIGSVLSSVLLVMTPKTKKKIKTKTESMKRKITRKINLSKNKITKAARAVKRKSKSSYYNNEVKENLKFKNEIKEKDFRAFIERLAEWKESWKEKILSRRRARAEIRAQNFIRKRFEKLRKLIELKKNKIKDKTQTKTNLKNNLREKAGELIGKITGILFRSRIKSDGEDDASRISRFSSKNGSSAQVSWKNKAGNSRKTIKNNSYLDNYAKVSGKYIKNFGNVIKKCKGSVAQWIELTNYINKTKEEINKCTVRATGCSGEARTFSNWVRFPTRTHRYLKQGYNNYLKVSEEKKKENKGSNRVWSKTTSLPGLPSQIDKRKNLFILVLSQFQEFLALLETLLETMILYLINLLQMHPHQPQTTCL
ncbi:hypothetical protein HYT56_05535 [Candidatus Woesearchaeota archaeon]|nr:hypothetical protein [Candidatus Woesearchaeota archaeon]